LVVYSLELNSPTQIVTDWKHLFFWEASSSEIFTYGILYLVHTNSGMVCHKDIVLGIIFKATENFSTMKVKKFAIL
jgi:hypothetical protein